MERSPRRRDAWLRHKMGARLLATERTLLEGVLADLFGYFLLQVGGWGRHSDLCATSRVRHRFVLDLPGGEADLLTDPEYLPIASASVDVVVLPHTLERTREPHRVLREVERILIGEGHVVVLGFPPWSPWRVFRGVRGRAVSERRLKDWLALLGFDVLSVVRHSPKLPTGAYLVLARKRVYGMTPIRPKWHSSTYRESRTVGALPQ